MMMKQLFCPSTPILWLFEYHLVRARARAQVEFFLSDLQAPSFL